MPVSVAIDGPAGAGKSTVAKKAAAVLGFTYVDTGAVYRSVTFFCDRAGVNKDDDAAVSKALEGLSADISFKDGAQHVSVNGEDVTDMIRTPKISSLTSFYAAKPCVRAFLLELQREMARSRDVIMDGRDIGTVVLPDADVKIFLTASPEVRAKRRYDELRAKGENVSFDDILSSVNQRDRQDSERSAAPLKQAEDAIYLDTGDMDIDAAVQRVVDIVRNEVCK
ncbi:MAG: (d)CMP kinase [Oribacterium sp.]|nr:(d)CMP kinase [Oribacterium sp.]MBQ5330718.1 (d)CMP kinase [Oscillospiraceae bacterium]